MTLGLALFSLGKVGLGFFGIQLYGHGEVLDSPGIPRLGLNRSGTGITTQGTVPGSIPTVNKLSATLSQQFDLWL
jgi:hypothetical protein